LLDAFVVFSTPRLLLAMRAVQAAFGVICASGDVPIAEVQKVEWRQVRVVASRSDRRVQEDPERAGGDRGRSCRIRWVAGGAKVEAMSPAASAALELPHRQQNRLRNHRRNTTGRYAAKQAAGFGGGARPLVLQPPRTGGELLAAALKTRGPSR
jgi:hypothetical protein